MRRRLTTLLSVPIQLSNSNEEKSKRKKKKAIKRKKRGTLALMKKIKSEDYSNFGSTRDRSNTEKPSFSMRK